MNKIAAYQNALAVIELEKRAEYLVDTYGTCDGYLPSAYVSAFDEMEKEAILSAAGKAVTGGMMNLGMRIPGKPGAALMDAASSLYKNEGARKLVGGTALGTAAAVPVGLGGSFLLGRASKQ